MTRTRGIDQHVAALRELEGRLVDPDTQVTWCEVHLTQRSPCSSCAGDHKAGEHHSTVIRSCRHCQTLPPSQQPDARALAARNDA